MKPSATLSVNNFNLKSEPGKLVISADYVQLDVFQDDPQAEKPPSIFDQAESLADQFMRELHDHAVRRDIFPPLPPMHKGCGPVKPSK